MKILIIDDNEKLNRMLKKAIEREGHEVDCLTDGKMAERIVEISRNVYDLLILDLMLPGQNGFALYQNLRDKHIRIPTLVLTARGDEKDREHAFQLGICDYMTKPFLFRDLLERIKSFNNQ